ncbi:sulfatase family protein [Pleomorphomonas carboxyditropha]|uniref:Arylsulfatase n=1 Tax=Pleomorphomonas carboxyditropha TaxID=2023338 RepID=A0A2G9X060_9HYPH|nr:sulfatase-like hydrolase/transferase [Pleomorphomonas carboxyditropha]PIP00315.1 arylsulfatase [Pleomorphomonas carboxyditropha]
MAARPNIILIITDQQRYDSIGALGFPYASTPNIDALAERGVVFSNCHITAPSCVPSRASLFTGYYPHSTGILANGQKWRRTWVSQLREAGYRCVNVGKMHTVPYDADAGFDERYVVENKDRYLDGRWFFDEWDKALAAHGLVKQQRELYRQRDDYRERLGAFDWELPEELHSDTFVANMAKWWVNTYPKTEPLFLQVGFPGPHPPYDPPARYSAAYLDRDDLPLPAPSQAEIDSLPTALREKRHHDVAVDHDSVAWDLEPSREQLQRLWAHYLGNVTLIDEKIGELLGVLGDRGYLDDAIVIFASDHGECLGDHGLSQKWSMYDAVTRVPAIVWSTAGRFAGGRRVDGLCQLFDLGPTILEYAGITPPASFEAASLKPALEGTAWTPRAHVFFEQAGDISLTGADFIIGVRSENWKLVQFKGTDEGQLFDLDNDPAEVDNLWDDPAHLDKRRELLDAIRDWLIESNYRTRDLLAEAR